MFDSLGKIRNPLLRSLTAAFTAMSVITIGSAIVMGITQSKDESAQKTALYASLIGTGCGALFGLSYTNRPQSSNTAQTNTAQTLGTAAATASGTTDWSDWRDFVVVRKVQESEEITSFYLQPVDEGRIPNFQPGQFLTIKLDIPGQARPVIRTYSLSDYAEPCDYYRLSIKREPSPPKLAVMPGLASNFMHDSIQVGSVIPAKPPSGRFFLDVHQTPPAVLISNGVGITPMISMAKAVTRLNPSRPVWFLHGAREGRFHAFRDEVQALAQQNPNLRIHFAYSRPSVSDTDHHSTGYVDADLIQSLVPPNAEYFLCGSPPFLDGSRAGLNSAGVPENRVFFEIFAKASPTTRDRPTTTATAETTHNTKTMEEIKFARSQQTSPWSADAENLLEFAEANGLNPPYSCRQGLCGTCECKLLEGEVEYLEPPTADVTDGAVLICIAKPKTARLVLDL
jgi:uncharacterized protein